MQKNRNTWSDNKVRELACYGSSGQKTWYGLMTLGYQLFTAMLLLIYGNLFLSGVYYYLSVFRCAIVRMLELLVKLGKSESKIREMLVKFYDDNAMKKTTV
jgi:hypothetical protein